MMRHLRALSIIWTLSAFVPLPALLIVEPDRSAELACIYLGLACAWLAVEIMREGGRPGSRAAWRGKMGAIAVAVTGNVALVVVLGMCVGVRSNIPFGLMAAFAATPAVGLVPWLAMRVRPPHAAIILGCMIVAGAKLSGCVVARFVYGANYIQLGYVSDDWHTAKLMISIFWAVTIGLSIIAIVADFWRFKPEAVAAPAAGP